MPLPLLVLVVGFVIVGTMGLFTVAVLSRSVRDEWISYVGEPVPTVWEDVVVLAACVLIILGCIVWLAYEFISAYGLVS